MRLKTILAVATAGAALAAVPVASAVSGSGSSDVVDVGDQVVEQARAKRAQVPGEPTRAPFPLTGIGENMELVANIPIDFGSDIELAGDYAYVGTYGTCSGATPPGPPAASQCVPGSGGITAINIANPEQPFVAGLFDCAGGQNDPQLSPDGRYMVMAIETRNNHCHPGEEGTVVLSLEDPANPREIAFLPIFDQAGAYVGSHNNTLDWPYLYIDQYVARYNRIDIFDLSNPAAPVKLPGIQYGAPARPEFSTTSPHDLIVDHRPDGKDYLYASSGNQTSDVIDVTNPRNPRIVQRLVDPAVTFAHQSEPNHDRSLALITDEYRGGGESRACGKTSTDGSPRDPAPTPGSNDRNNLGALYLYKTKADGTLESTATGNPVVAGTYNLPLQNGGIDPNLGQGAQGCTIHIYWQAPDEDRIVVSWYGKGIRVADFSDPKRTRELGWYIPTSANTWSAKPHNGYIFTGDIERGFDVLRYTGEDGGRWPSTAGPAEVQRARIQGAEPPAGAAATASAQAAAAAPTVNSNPGPARLASGSSRPGFRAALNRARGLAGTTFSKTAELGAGGSGPVVLTVRNSRGGVVSKMRFDVRAGQRRLRMRAAIAGIAGRYRYTAERGGKRLAAGAFDVKGKTAANFRLKAGQTLVCRIIR